jgi:hypothetical protein
MKPLRIALPLLFLLVLGCGDDGTGSDAGPDASGCGACDDGVFCNGTESCVDGICQPGTPPCGGACDEDADECVAGCADADGDGDCAIAEGGTDCDDEDPERYGGAVEICDAAGVDEDCDSTTLGADDDGDGYAPTECCNEDGDAFVCGQDCNDASMEVNPEAEEICDERDNDCDGTSDEGVQMLYYRDADSDNYGVDADTVLACSLPTGGYTVRGGDCDDDLFDDDPSDPPANERNPGRTEICNTVDDDCDGVPDPADCACTEPESRSCAEAGFLGACAVGTQTCIGGTWAGCPAPAANESCGGGDEDCDGVTDEPGADGAITCWADADEDGFASNGALTMMRCSCTGSWTDVDPASNADCDDGDPMTYPGATERCDRKLNDCSNIGHNPSLEDFDGDGYAAASAPCTGGFPRTDCDDRKSERNPGATFGTEPLCEPGRQERSCPVDDGSEVRCLEERACPSTCSIGDGVELDPRTGCPSGTLECTCDQPVFRCISRATCSGCTPSDGSAPRGGSCGGTSVLCPCYTEWVTSCEPSASCLLNDSSEATEADVYDFDCDGAEELPPDETGYDCNGASGTLTCERACPGTCLCPEAIYVGTRECGAEGVTGLMCNRGLAEECNCEEQPRLNGRMPCR